MGCSAKIDEEIKCCEPIDKFLGCKFKYLKNILYKNGIKHIDVESYTVDPYCNKYYFVGILFIDNSTILNIPAEITIPRERVIFEIEINTDNAHKNK